MLTTPPTFCPVRWLQGRNSLVWVLKETGWGSHPGSNPGLTSSSRGTLDRPPPFTDFLDEKVALRVTATGQFTVTGQFMAT